MLKRSIRRLFHSAAPRLSKKVAVIGAGPSGFYTSLNLLKDTDPNLQVDMFEKNPCPYGLVRYGVAPDHPEVKNCQDRFADTRQDGRFQYFGNVFIGDDLLLKELYENYDVVVYSYGSSLENKLGIPGEDDHPAIVNSRAFVGWYNGDPEYIELDPPLEKVSDVVIIGNGNVAIDIARILLAPADTHWQSTDITARALDKLKQSKVSKVTIVARRGFLESKFTNKEFRELLELHKVGVHFGGWPDEKFASLKELKLGRTDKRRLQLVNKYVGLPKSEKAWYLDYLKSPIGFKVSNDDADLLEEIIFRNNEITIELVDGKIKSEIKPGEGFSSIKAQLVIPSIGYKCEPMAEFEQLGIPFDSKHGIIPNVGGKVTGREDSFVVGWIANGARGNINSTVMSSSILAGEVAKTLAVTAKGASKPGREATEKLLSDRQVQVVNWDDWVKIADYEQQQGSATGKPSEKVTNFDEMLRLVK